MIAGMLILLNGILKTKGLHIIVKGHLKFVLMWGYVTSMKILKDSEYQALKDQIKALIDEKIKLEQEIYSLKRQLNFANFRADNFKGLSFPNSEIKDERSANEVLDDMGKTVHQLHDLFRKTLYNTGEPETPDFSDY